MKQNSCEILFSMEKYADSRPFFRDGKPVPYRGICRGDSRIARGRIVMRPYNELLKTILQKGLKCGEICDKLTEKTNRGEKYEKLR